MKFRQGCFSHKPKTPFNSQDTSLPMQGKSWVGCPAACLGRKKHRAAGELWVCGSHKSTQSLLWGSPAPCCHPALERKLVYFPELVPMSLVGLGTIGLEISLGGAAATVPSRMTPILAQGFFLPVDWRHGSRENIGSVHKMASVCH